MSEDFEKAGPDAARNAAILKAMMGIAIGRSFDRLSDITDEELADNQAFDRAARTAHVFLRLAIESHELLARIDKDKAKNDSAEQCSLARQRQVDNIVRRVRERVPRDAAGPDDAAAPMVGEASS